MSSAPIEPNPPLSRNHRLVALTQNMLDSKAQRMIGLAHNTLDIESQAILGMKKTIGPSFVRAVRILLQASGRVVVMGMGKSGHIGRKIASTLASTGTVAMFVHPAEASHGDLGMIKDTDVALVLSNSGESEEIIVLLPLLQRQGVPIVAITAGAQSTLAKRPAHSTWPPRPARRHSWPWATRWRWLCSTHAAFRPRTLPGRTRAVHWGASCSPI